MQLANIIFQKAASWKQEVGSWKLEVGSWKLKPEICNLKSAT
jgi:hypothetical protein